MKQEIKQPETRLLDSYPNANQLVISNIKENYERTEQGIVNELYFKAPHSGTIGRQREKIWESMFENIVSKKFVIEQSVFIIDSQGQVSREVDLAIFDVTYTPYIFKYGELKFIPIEAVAVVIECKSTSMEKEALKKWVSSIRSLKTSKKSIARVIDSIACGENSAPKTQTATRPLRILCCLNEIVINETLEEEEKLFDIVIRANAKEEKMHIEWADGKSNLYDWYIALNHAEGLTENNGVKVNDWVNIVKKYHINQYQVDYKNANLSLLTFNFQLNQLLMLLNNPMLFPHAAYAKMFQENGNGEENKNG